VRVTRTDHGIVVGGPSDGRGAWLCRGTDGRPTVACVDAALARHGFERAWRSGLDVVEAQTIRELAGGGTSDTGDRPDAH
jgi:predicted RNA-binding protein YlxR (DUF448 family)